jgi:hypothetical protein
MSYYSKTEHPRNHVDTDVFVIYSTEHWPTMCQLFEKKKKTLYIKIMEKNFTLIPLKPSVCYEGTNMTQLSSVTKQSTSSPVLNKLAQSSRMRYITDGNVTMFKLGHPIYDGGIRWCVG